MNVKVILFTAIFIALFLETTIIPFPLVFIFSVILYVFYPEISIVIVAFLASIIIGSLRMQPMGMSSIVTLFSFGVIDLIRKFVALKDIKALIPFLLIASFIFAFIFNYDTNLLIYLLVYGLAGLVAFVLYRKRLIW